MSKEGKPGVAEKPAVAEAEVKEEEKAEEATTEVKEEVQEEAIQADPKEPANTSSTYLWCLLLEVSLGSRHAIVPHLTRLLLQAFSHQTAPSDIALTHLPLLTRLLQAVKAEEQRGDFHAAAFGGRSSPSSRADVQLRAYLHLFSALAFSPASVRPYTALLEQTLGLETSWPPARLTRRVCCLALRFFYLARVRAIVKAGTTNGLSAIA